MKKNVLPKNILDQVLAIDLKKIKGPEEPFAAGFEKLGVMTPNLQRFWSLLNEKAGEYQKLVETIQTKNTEHAIFHLGGGSRHDCKAYRDELEILTAQDDTLTSQLEWLRNTMFGSLELEFPADPKKGDESELRIFKDFVLGRKYTAVASKSKTARHPLQQALEELLSERLGGHVVFKS